MKVYLLLVPVLTLASAFASFPDQFEYELQHKSRILSEEAQREVAKYHYVLVTGVFNEFLAGYFGDNRTSLKKEMGARKVSLINPPTHLSVEDNARDLARELAALYAQGGNAPLVIVGHSKGALESLLVMTRDPVFLAHSVHRLVLLQPPVGGSPLADRVVDWCKKNGGVKVKHLFCNFGLSSLTTGASSALWEAELGRLSAETRHLIQSKVSMIQARQIRNRDVTTILKFFHHWLAGNFGENDGLVLLRDQSLGDWVPVLGVVDSDHSDLVSSRFVSQSPKRFRRAFMRALILEVLGIGENSGTAPRLR
jgi:pimeloyl-ACP methyl ester carboxylesterase